MENLRILEKINIKKRISKERENKNNSSLGKYGYYENKFQKLKIESIMIFIKINKDRLFYIFLKPVKQTICNNSLRTFNILNRPIFL
jgi:hypothetical protein